MLDGEAFPDAKTVVSGRRVGYHNSMPEPTTRLAKITAAKAAEAKTEAVEESKLAKWSKLGKRGDYATIEGIGRVWIQLAPHSDTNAVESETWAEMSALNLPPIGINALTYDSEKAVRTLARSVRDPDNHAERFGSVEDWHDLDDDMISVAFQAYHDVRTRLHPSIVELTEEEIREIRDAISKKNAILLRTFGVAKLSLYLLTTANPPSDSATGKLSNGGMPSESSTPESSSA